MQEAQKGSVGLIDQANFICRQTSVSHVSQKIASLVCFERSRDAYRKSQVGRQSLSSNGIFNASVQRLEELSGRIVCIFDRDGMCPLRQRGLGVGGADVNAEPHLERRENRTTFKQFLPHSVGISAEQQLVVLPCKHGIHEIVNDRPSQFFRLPYRKGSGYETVASFHAYDAYNRRRGSKIDTDISASAQSLFHRAARRRRIDHPCTGLGSGFSPYVDDVSIGSLRLLLGGRILCRVTRRIDRRVVDIEHIRGAGLSPGT